jgi:hypothetical protein
MVKGDLCNKGNTDDIRCSLRNGGYNIMELYDELLYELEHKNRSTVCAMIQNRIDSKKRNRYIKMD